MRGFGWTVDARPGVEALADPSMGPAYDVVVLDWPPPEAVQQETSAMQVLQARDGIRIVGVACNLSSARVDAVPRST
ncbi:hypothetical protein, partial [Mycobacterium tuberculosis]